MSRVILLALNYRISPRIRRFAEELVAHGTDVDFVVADRGCVAELALDPRVRVHPVLAAEPFAVRLERFLLFRVPGGLLARGRRRLAGGGRAGRRLDRVLAATQRAHGWVARAVHHRIFMRIYTHVRPLVLARRFRRLAGVEVASADRIVAGDISSVALGWRLARRYPDLTATTSLDARPFRRTTAPV